MSIHYLLALVVLIPCTGMASSPLPSRSAENTERIREFEAQRAERIPSLDADSSHSYDMLELSADYRVEDAQVPAVGTATITLTATETQSLLPFNAELLQVTGIQESSSDIPFFVQNDTVYVDRPVIAGDTITLVFSVTVPVVGDYGDVGYHAAWRHVFTFAEPYGARRWYPCFDQPFDKFNRVTLTVNMPDYWSLAANGDLVETTYPEAGRKREVYVHDYPISTYLVMICAGEYAKRYESVNGVEYRYFTFPEDSLKAVYDWGRTPQMVSVFDNWYGPYPFDAYGMVQAALFNGWGAMEHQTFTTYGYHLVDSLRSFEGIVAHELAHMWFGDALSPVDFRNIWLNEGFATYATALWDESLGGESAYRTTMNDVARYYFQEDSVYRYAAYDPPMQHLFGAVIYYKGAYVLHMLREQLLGDSLMREALHAYTNAHQYGTVNTEDFISAVNGVADQDLHWFFDQWIYEAGHPVIDVTVASGSPTIFDVSVSVTQLQTDAPIFRFPLNIDVQMQDGTITRQFWFEEQTQTVTQTFGSPVISATESDYQPLLYRQAAQRATSSPAALPTQVCLDAPYPNPFNSSVKLSFELSRTAVVTMNLYDLSGRLVQEIISGVYGSGTHVVWLNADPSLASGMYFLALESGASRSFQKMVLLK